MHASSARMTLSSNRRVWGAVAGVASASLVLLYARYELSLPRGPAEFVAWPPLEPLPFAPLRGFSYEQLARHAARLLLLTPAGVLLTAALTWLAGGALGVEAWRHRVPKALAVVGILASCWACLGVLQGRALLDDELVYAQQAELLSRGRLGETEVPPWAPEAFTIRTGVGATGKYMFGEPLVQVPGVALGVPALSHLLLLGLAVAVLHMQARRALGASAGAWVAAALALSPMVVLTSATGLSHVTSLACMVVAGFAAHELLRDSEDWRWPVLLGSALGLGVTVRMQTAVPVGGVIFLMVAAFLARRRRWRLLLGVLGAGAPWAVLVGAYNRATTGSVLSLPWSLYRPVERYGFGQVLEGDDFVHGVRTAAENLAIYAVRFNAWWLGLPLGLALLVLWIRQGRPWGREPLVRMWQWAGAALIAFHVPYYSTGVSETGPVYLFELIVPLSFVAAAVLVTALERWPDATRAAVVAHLLLGTAWFLAENVQRLEREIELVHGPAESLLATVDAPALVLYETAPQENVRLGWINSGFPKRWRHPDAPVVTYPRGDGVMAASLRAHYRDRACWYFRVDPSVMQPQLLRCETVETLLARPARLEGRPLAIASTAMRRNLLDPFAGRGDAARDGRPGD